MTSVEGFLNQIPLDQKKILPLDQKMIPNHHWLTYHNLTLTNPFHSTCSSSPNILRAPSAGGRLAESKSKILLLSFSQGTFPNIFNQPL
jgi:hypothetical protein